MATWNQGGIAGSLLGGIGGVNSNAPRATDANTALSLIRENNDIQRSGANNPVLQGLQGLYGVAQMYQADQQAQRQKDFLQKYGAARADGNTSSMRQLFAEFPEMNEQIGKGMTGISADTKESIGNLAAGFRTAAATGSGDQFVAKNAAEFLRVGVDPADLQKRLKEDPNSAVELADWVGLSAVGSEKYFDIIDAKEGRQIDRGKLAETVRSNQAGEALTARGQDVQVRGQNLSYQSAMTGHSIARERLNLDRELKAMETQEKVLDRRLARETNELKRAELEQKLEDVQAKKEINKSDRQAAAQGAVDTFSTALDSLNEIENSPGLSKAVGMMSAFPTIPGSDAANFEARLDTFKAQTFLPMVQSLKGMGALSDAEGKKLSDAVGALSPKMSEKAFRDSIGKIRGQLESKLGTVKKQFDYQEPQQEGNKQPAQQKSGYSSLWGD